jgi:hypothetical protein
MSYLFLKGASGAVQPHTSFRFRVDLYNLLHKLHDVDEVFSQCVMSAELNFTEGLLKVKVASPVNGALDEFLELLFKDSVWVLRVVLLDNDNDPTVGYRLTDPFLVSHSLGGLSYDNPENVYHEFGFGFMSKHYERLSPSLKALVP